MAYSIVIPSRNLENVTRAIAAIHEVGCNARVIIIDDTETLELSYKNIRGFPTSIPGARPFCFARNVNIGIKGAGRDDVLVMNDDALVQELRYGTDNAWGSSIFGNPIAALSRAAEDQSFGLVSAAIVGASKTRFTDPESYPHMKQLHPETWDLLSVRPINGAMVPFVCVFIPRRTIDTVGLLEERFEGVYGGEDDDYCYRVRKAGLKIGVYDGCVVDHGTLRSTFRPDGRGLDITATRKRFRDIHGFEIGTR